MAPRFPSVVICVVLLALSVVGGASPVGAQVREGATLTVLRGQVAVIKADGSAIQPAPSGTIVNAGDELRTLTRTGALITFFAGTEVEMGEDTILVVERVSQEGARVDVSLKQVLGVTVNRVQTLADPSSSYRIGAGGATAIVRGTTIALIGPVPTSQGNIVALICLDDCTPRTTFAGCPVAPFTAIGVLVEAGRVTSGCEVAAVGRGADLWNAAFEAISTFEQTFAQGNNINNPGGENLGRERGTVQSDRRNRRREADDSNQSGLAAPSTSAGVSPAPAGAAGCNQATNSGGAGVTTTVHDLGRGSGTFHFTYDAFSIPDRFDILYDGRTIYTTGGFVSGSNAVDIQYGGAATTVTVVVTGSAAGTAWTYQVGCPT